MSYVFYLVMSLRATGGKQRVIDVLPSYRAADDQKRTMEARYPHIRFWIET
jgi:hypothetical protein